LWSAEENTVLLSFVYQALYSVIASALPVGHERESQRTGR
jgi:hypothetical protein